MSHRTPPPARPARPARLPRPPSPPSPLLVLLVAALALGCEPDAKVNAAAEGIPVAETEAEMDVTDLEDDPDAERVPPVGEYAYAAVHPIPATGDTMRLEGLLVLTETDDDRIEGRWDAEQLHPDLHDGEWEGGAYVATAKTSYPGRIRHRIRVGADGALACDGRFTWVAEGGIERGVPVRCTLLPADAVPGTPGLSTPGSRAVRDADVPQPRPPNTPEEDR